MRFCRVSRRAAGAPRSWNRPSGHGNKVRRASSTPVIASFRKALASAAGEPEAMDCGACLCAGHSYRDPVFTICPAPTVSRCHAAAIINLAGRGRRSPRSRCFGDRAWPHLWIANYYRLDPTFSFALSMTLCRQRAALWFRLRPDFALCRLHPHRAGSSPLPCAGATAVNRKPRLPRSRASGPPNFPV